MAGSHQDNGGSKEPRPPQPPLAVRAHGVRDAPPPCRGSPPTHLPVGEAAAHVIKVEGPQLPQATVHVVHLGVAGLQAIPFETHTSVTFRVSVCVTGEGGRGG